jgi:hypothetical protein
MIIERRTPKERVAEMENAVSMRTSAASVPTRWDVVVFRTLDT